MPDDADEKPPDKITRPFMAALACYACQFQVGTLLGQSSTMLPQLEADDSPIKIDYDSATWIAAMDCVGTPIACLVSGPLTDKIGRKATMLIFMMIAGVGNAIIGVSTNVTEILIGRFCLGIASGFAFPAQVYVAEISTAEHRTPLLTICTISSSLGLLYVFIIGAFLSWDSTALVTASLSMISLAYASFVPESPAWLFRKHQLNDAIDSIRWLKGHECDMTHELKLLKDACTEETKSSGFGKILRDFTSPTVAKPFIILVFLALLQNGTGFYILLHFSINFIDEFDIMLDARYVSIGLGLMRVLSCVFALYFLPKVGRKTAGIVSGVSTAAVLGALIAALVYFKGHEANSTAYTIIFTVCLLVLILVCGLGIYPLPWMMIFELYPLHVRGLMSGLSYAISHIFIFTFLKLYYIFLFNLQLEGTIGLFLVFCLIFSLFSLFVLPETQGKTLVEIEEGFMSKKQREKSPE